METKQHSLCWHINVADEEEAAILIARLDGLGASGFEEKEGELLAYTKADESLRAAVSSLLEGLGLVFTVEEILPQNWNEVWESNFHPLLVDNRVYLRAYFHEPHQSADYQLVVTPKMSFGTGHHATTQLMIKAMLQLDFEHKKVLDFGTGTGVLAMLAEKMGATEVLAIDNDDWSIENAAENIEVNHCNCIKIQKDEKPNGEAYDIVLANINRHILINNASIMAAAVPQTGKILISGILESDKMDLEDAFQKNGMVQEKWMTQTGWVCGLFTKK